MEPETILTELHEAITVLETAWARVKALMKDMERRGSDKPVKRLVGLAAAGEYIDRSEDAVRKLIANGRIKATRIDGRVQIDVRDLDRLIDNSK